ncbi:hypothetical protein V6N11_015652 [Hibiscus sabdariffa]|uniref:Flavin-containing monooxygenase n=1 Tax=Hibiscus sabdariffa TaxID=183260 RepID=A0ABR2TST1_9ROSI
MGFLDYLFVKKEGGDQRHFPCHEEVLRFLEDFARDFGLMGLIRFQHEVVRVERVDDASHDWVVESRTREIEPKWKSKEEVFEAVVICNGNHTEPKIAEFPEILGQDCKCIAITTELLNSLKNKIECAHKNGEVTFQDGSIVDVDVIIHCTGWDIRPLNWWKNITFQSFVEKISYYGNDRYRDA